MKTWKLFGSECIHCGGVSVVNTSADEPGYAYEDDDAKCLECGCPGVVNVDADSRAWIAWHDEPNCNCDWCKAHPVV